MSIPLRRGFWHRRAVRPSTILLAAITVVFGAATIVLAVLIGTDEGRALSTELRLGMLITFGFGVACVTTEVNHRRRARLRQKAETHPGTVFVTAHATESTATDLTAWNPRLRVWFPCDLGFDRTGITHWSTRNDGHGTPIALRSEVLGFDVFREPTPRGVAYRWGIVVRLAPRTSVPGAVRMWVADDQPAQDEYAMRRTISRIESALGMDH
ncbi:hypothetical protein [Curtobacterium sp. Leaf183]|uniref:hypothetical protein n=1 Tax=Curtobacterium sp. Leaf183 TaxID=1736291 RepID=UPI0012E739DE|nr:hypothetical protein [Curtobacterium sp. Leaf183]